MKRIHIYLTEEQIKALDDEAARTGLKRSEIVRQKLADVSRLETYASKEAK